MRLHDRLMTETPRPWGADEPFTDYATLFEDAQVIDGTDVMQMFFEVERAMMDEAAKVGVLPTGEEYHPYTYFALRFCDYDWSGMTMNLPPFQKFIIEFDAEKAINETRREGTRINFDRNMGTLGVSVYVYERDEYLEDLKAGPFHGYEWMRPECQKVVRDLRQRPGVKYVMHMSLYSTIPMHPIVGPLLTFVVPVNEDGTIPTGDNGTPMTMLGHATSFRDTAVGEMLVEASKYAYIGMLPAILAINFMNTPRGDKGYHSLVEKKPAKSPNKHFQRKNFRNLTSWHVLDISPLREALKESIGGRISSPSDLVKALHIVRGNTATYLPNTYFGKKHDNPITVFRPAHKRGDLSAGKVDKDYRLDKGA